MVVYRDGVGDGQIAQVKDMEVVKIKEAFKANNIDPKFTYVIVSKRVSKAIVILVSAFFSNHCHVFVPFS